MGEGELRERVAALEAALGALVETDPIVRLSSARYYCHHCGAWDWQARGVVHADDCAYVRAAALVAAPGDGEAKGGTG